MLSKTPMQATCFAINAHLGPHSRAMKQHNPREDGEQVILTAGKNVPSALGQILESLIDAYGL